MFELPKGSVKPGNIWDINFICLELGVGFTEDFADRVNMVRLTNVRKNVQLEKIAENYKPMGRNTVQWHGKETVIKTAVSFPGSQMSAPNPTIQVACRQVFSYPNAICQS